mgnify:CR=1 FL=1
MSLLKVKQDELQALINEANALSTKTAFSDAESLRVRELPQVITAKMSEIESASALQHATSGADKFLNGGLSSIVSQLNPAAIETAVQQTRALGGATQFIDRAGTDLIRQTAGGDARVIDAEGWGISEKQMKAISEPTYESSFNRFMRGKADAQDYRMTLTEGADGAGGYLVPPQWMTEIIKRDAYPTSLLGYVNEVTATRDKMIFPRVNYDSDTNDIYTSGVRIQWIGEQGPTPAITDPVFGDVEIPVYTGQFPLEVSRNLLDDSPYTVAGIIQELASEAYNLGMESVVVNGTGAGQPKGFLINPGGTGLEPPSYNLGNPITANNLTSTLIYGMPPQYMSDLERTIAIMNQTSAFATFAVLADTSGQRIFGLFRYQGPEGMAAPVMPYIHGYKCIMSAFMPNVGANAYPIAFGNLKKAYVLARRLGLSVMPYGDQDKSMLAANKVGWFFRFRAGGQVVQNRALHIGKQA